MPAINHQLLIQLAVFIVLIFSTQFTYSYASTEDENAINEIIETRGKNNIVDFILLKRNRKITIQKKKSFLDVTGKPDLALVTAKSIDNDLRILEMDVSTMESELDAYIENENKKKQKARESLNKSASPGSDEEIPLSRQLKHQISITRSKYNEADNEYDRKKLKKELSRLERKYKEAKYNEKYNPGGTSGNSGNSRKTSSYNSYSSSCDNYKSQLKKMTEASYRHRVYYCGDSTYRAEHPKTCGKYRYSSQYSVQQYKEKLGQLRSKISKYCKS